MGGTTGGNWRVALLLAVAAQALPFVFQPRGAAADFLSPLISPLTNASCEIAQCGKGTCKPADSSSSTSLLGLVGLGFTCECDPGWKRLITNNDTFQFLPCVIPNCSINYSCTSEAPAPPPPPPSLNLFNWSIFDPCLLSACGEGNCVKTSPLTYRCDCRPGTRNLLNLTSFPCFSDCVLGADCSELGLGFSRTPPSGPTSATTVSASPPAPANKDTSSAPTVSASPPDAVNKDSTAPTVPASPPNAAVTGPGRNMLWPSILMMILVAFLA